MGITKRSKKRFEGQQMVVLLGGLAHNVLMWARRWLSSDDPKLARYGVLRLVRDVLHVSGLIELDATNKVSSIVLNHAAPLARRFADAFRALLQPHQVILCRGRT